MRLIGLCRYPTRHRWLGVASLTVALGWVGALDAQEAPPRQVDRQAVEAAVRTVLDEPNQDAPIRAGVWVGGATGPAWYASQADVSLPTASAIKTAILIELFGKFTAELDQAVPGLDTLLVDDHPTIAHFSPDQRDEVRQGLAGVSIRRLGGIMMGSVPASNLVYNAAASVSIALLGGPTGTTRLIGARDPAFGPITVRRYMLADRTKPGDNVATTEALAAVLQRLASRQIPGLEAATVEAIRQAVITVDDPQRGRLHVKEGSLESDPIIIVRSGWLEPTVPGPPVVVVVMLAQDTPGRRSRDQANEDLARLGDRLMMTLIDQVSPASR